MRSASDRWPSAHLPEPRPSASKLTIGIRPSVAKSPTGRAPLTATHRSDLSSSCADYTQTHCCGNALTHDAHTHTQTMGLKENLKAALDRLGENPTSLSVRARVPQPTIHRILNGTSAQPRRENVEKLAAALGVPVEELYGSKKISGLTIAREDSAPYSSQEPRFRPDPRTITAALDQVLRIAGLDLSVIGGRDAIRDKVAEALAGEFRVPPESEPDPGYGEFDINTPNQQQPEPFFNSDGSPVKNGPKKRTA